MFGERPLNDVVRAARAIATNQIARFLPRTYIEMTGETGRGRLPASPADVAAYHSRCFDDYVDQLGLDRATVPQWLEGKDVLEYGPGDVLGTAFLFVAYGARSVTCVDRFPLLGDRRFRAEVFGSLFQSLPERVRARAADCFATAGDPRSDLVESRIRYKVTPDGLAGEQAKFSLAISRAVLEHVNDLPATFRDMGRALGRDGVALHLVDLKSHGLHEANPLDFLTWPDWLWTLMYSCKGVPNRLRPEAYRQAIAAAGLVVTRISPTELEAREQIAQVRPFLAAPFRDTPEEELAWRGFWLLCRPAARA